MGFLNFHMLGIFLLGISAGIFLQTIPLPPVVLQMTPYLGFIFLVVGVLALMSGGRD
ncbi:MAG: hypothetical protein HY917_05135 [Candidatus Diapherotrites archaeon]|nr:hypothetical protein [Candidatus Diapherotrites archaeon]